MADYPNNIPKLPVYGRNQYPRSADRNTANREIEAICTELGVNPRTISDVVAPAASPASVAAYFDMLANIVKTMTGAANWQSAAVPQRRMWGGHGDNGTVPASTSIGLYSFGAGMTSNQDVCEMMVCFKLAINRVTLYLGSAQPASGSLVIKVRVNFVDKLILTLPAGLGAGIYSAVNGGAEILAYPGDGLDVVAVNNAAAASGSIRGWTVEVWQRG